MNEIDTFLRARQLSGELAILISNILWLSAVVPWTEFTSLLNCCCCCCSWSTPRVNIDNKLHTVSWLLSRSLSCSLWWGWWWLLWPRVGGFADPIGIIEWTLSLPMSNQKTHTLLFYLFTKLIGMRRFEFHLPPLPSDPPEVPRGPADPLPFLHEEDPLWPPDEAIT